MVEHLTLKLECQWRNPLSRTAQIRGTLKNSCSMPIPSEALKRERVETRRAAPKVHDYGEGIVQTTNLGLFPRVVKTIVVS